MNRILLIEDEHDIRHAIKEALELDGFIVDANSNAEEALLKFNNQSYSLILLDMMLPKMQGETFLKLIRMDSDIPIIIISALSDELIQLDAFENKVDDYVVKPFSMNLLSYKIKALLRRVHPEQNDIITYQSLKLSIDNYLVEIDNMECDLTAKEFEILQLLLSNQGRVYSREEILTLIWGYDYFGDSRNIDVHIKNLRAKINFELIKTVKGVGYRIEKEKTL